MTPDELWKRYRVTIFKDVYPGWVVGRAIKSRTSKRGEIDGFMEWVEGWNDWTAGEGDRFLSWKEAATRFLAKRRGARKREQRKREGCEAL